ncbi:MAG: CDGSH iron-sulfur domain-containing protein [Candidatus Jidaibacter sp.]|jgi:CDGSH-type Zn-finger protein|nr:CDGSH iron-sulfur domain-containing protein [Candidatus Jidaibacter sp.]
MVTPKIALAKSIKIKVERGKTYMWCACGLSSTQPFCDGSHTGAGIAPIPYIAEEDKIVGFCGCKHSKLGPICDGSHKQFLEHS